MPSSVLLPLMKAVDTVGKEIDWPTVDFVTDRNNLRKLLRWASGSTGRSNDFRIDFELAGENTVLFNRFEERTKVMTDGKGYGFSFEHETTSPTPGCERSTAHHRIVKYDFFGLKMIVRFEVDAFLPSDEAVQSSGKSATTLDSLTDSLSTLQVTTESASPPGLQIIRAGSEVPHRSVIELKTSSKKHIRWSDIFPQLYLSQTPWFYVGFHEKGTFTEVQKSNMLEMKEQRKDLEGRLRQLGQTLEMIQELAIAHGTKKCLSLVCQSGVLTVYERVGIEQCPVGDQQENEC
ncbi:hypothetical protein EWM64_g8788 [Hericium alpestre]|uniref:Decapping nuclease n=1 Tax=Hericium alpestre TaxID=135208 RepID=A0A4Y9ZLR0_9AGAM|nr:hypothetical protein EWM64_g8788 [Hericium alpestre]